eukprot:TRINITY_DN2636_c0_g1_i1.p1 TRINITY_DN2636_c0_g1~~TRINITY_DN2636_c0_g1_i1.p1  ORF type:complete len:371 (-),score=29.40 TRINITY_DN2636_c0_g1_i1:232-1308(-)
MFSIYFYVVLCIGVVLSTEHSSIKQEQLDLAAAKIDPLDSFQRWSLQLQKNYTDYDQFWLRFEIWNDNLQYILKHNEQSESLGYQLGLTEYADLTLEEFKQAKGGGTLDLDAAQRYSDQAQSEYSQQQFLYTSDIPASVNWVAQGMVTPVEDQGGCGACWTFSACATVEALVAIQSGILTPLSEEEMIDCDKRGYGCKGGYYGAAYDWMRTQGILRYVTYPYTEGKTSCNNSLLNSPAFTHIKSWTQMPPNNEHLMMRQLVKQPIAVALQGYTRDFQLYRSGVYDGNCKYSLDHAAALVGYGTKNGKDYYLLKNSWGRNWGQDGYMYIARNYSDQRGKCGIAMYPAFPNRKHSQEIAE